MLATTELETAKSYLLRVMTSDRTWEALSIWLPELGVGVVRCRNIEELFRDDDHAGRVVLLDWATSDGLLTEEHQQEFRRLCKLMPVILLIPRGWRRMLTAADLGVAALHAKPLEVHTLIRQIRELASLTPVVATDGAHHAH